MSIPKIIHQTWKDENIPSEFIPFLASWKKHHPDWQFILWTDEMNKQFVEEHFPEFISIYNSYPYNIQRADAIRYLLLYKLGGVYVDLDIECFQNIEPLIDSAASLFIAKEPKEHCEEHKKEMILCNAWMASVPNYLFLKNVLVELMNSTFASKAKSEIVLNSTGPFMLSHVYQMMQDKSSIELLESISIHPLAKEKAWQLYEDENSVELKKQLKTNGSYAIHYFWGTWWRKANLSKK